MKKLGKFILVALVGFIIITREPVKAQLHDKLGIQI